VLQTAGSDVPTANGRVETAFEKSMFLACVRISTMVWAFAAAIASMTTTHPRANAEELERVDIFSPLLRF
jgi:hypothetical protein